MSDWATEDLQDQLVATKAELELLWRLTLALKYGQEPKCWCDKAIDNPMFREHRKACADLSALWATKVQSNG